MISVQHPQYPWSVETLPQKMMRRLRKLVGRSSYFRIGKSTLEVRPDMAWLFFRNGDYHERNVAYWLEKLLGEAQQKVFYDVGANYGYYSLKFARTARHIYAFEPVSRTHTVLMRNIQRNRLQNVTLYQCGLSDTTGHAIIYYYRSSRFNVSSAVSSLFLKSDQLPAGQETITLTTLDNIVQNKQIAPPDVIKMDIEGNELNALKGARETISAYHPIMVLEFETFEAYNFKEITHTRSDILAELQAQQYAVYGLSSDPADMTLYPVGKFGEVHISNIIAVPESMEDFLQKLK